VLVIIVKPLCLKDGGQTLLHSGQGCRVNSNSSSSSGAQVGSCMVSHNRVHNKEVAVQLMDPIAATRVASLPPYSKQFSSHLHLGWATLRCATHSKLGDRLWCAAAMCNQLCQMHLLSYGPSCCSTAQRCRTCGTKHNLRCSILHMQLLLVASSTLLLLLACVLALLLL
jgi:hypothetical protein